VPQDYADFDNAQQIYYKIGTLSNLIFSKYFINYYGFDDSTSQYFFEIIKGTSLKKILTQEVPDSTLLDTPKLFKYWANEILQAFSDLAYKCNHTFSQPLTLKNLYVADVGIKLFFKNIDNEQFGPQKKPDEKGTADNHIYYEAQILRNFATLLTEMIMKNTSDPTSLDTLKGIDPELRCILQECYRAADYGIYREEGEPTKNFFLHKFEA